jgi:hypothetical protein
VSGSGGWLLPRGVGRGRGAGGREGVIYKEQNMYSTVRACRMINNIRLRVVNMRFNSWKSNVHKRFINRRGIINRRFNSQRGVVNRRYTSRRGVISRTDVVDRRHDSKRDILSTGVTAAY